MRIVRVLSSVVVLSLLVAPSAAAQSSRPIDVSAQFSTLNLANLDATSVGVGGRVTVALSRWLSIDGELSVYPNDNFTESGFVIAGDGGLTFKRRRLEGLAGVKIGWRNDRFGVFGKARPGFVRLTNRGVDCTGDGCKASEAKLAGIDTQYVWTTGAIGEKTLFLYRSTLGETRLRVASLAELPNAKDTIVFDTPDFGGPTTGELRPLLSEQAALLIFSGEQPVALRVGGDGAASIVAL